MAQPGYVASSVRRLASSSRRRAGTRYRRRWEREGKRSLLNFMRAGALGVTSATPIEITKPYFYRVFPTPSGSRRDRPRRNGWALSAQPLTNAVAGNLLDCGGRAPSVWHPSDGAHCTSSTCSRKTSRDSQGPNAPRLESSVPKIKRRVGDTVSPGHYAPQGWPYHLDTCGVFRVLASARRKAASPECGTDLAPRLVLPPPPARNWW